MTTIPQVPLHSPGQLGTRYIQDDHRANFDRRNHLLMMERLPVDAVFIGDSLTGDWPVEQSFSDLWPLVINRGIGGDTAAQVTLRLQADCLQLNSRRVFFMIGTNDMAARYGYDDDAVILERLELHYRRSFQLLRAGGPQVLVGTIPPTRQVWQVDRMFERKRVLIPAANAILRRLAAEFGFPLLDYCAALEESPGVLRPDITTDGCHLTAGGYWLLNRVVREGVIGS